MYLAGASNKNIFSEKTKYLHVQLFKGVQGSTDESGVK